MLQVQDIRKAYHGDPVLDGVNFRLAPGECLGIRGENGSGKTTLLSILAQTSLPDSGNILWQGRSVLGDREFLRTSLGYVPQYSDLLPELTVGQQLALWRNACGCRKPLPADVSAFLGLEALYNKKIGLLSGGMQRRVSIAMALCNQPKLLIMDEATAGLDTACREALLQWLEHYLASGGMLLWCSHLPEEYRRLCTDSLTLTIK